MKIAIIQFAPELGNLSGTINRLKPLLQQAAGTDIVVLPELANSGYNFTSRQMARENAEVVEESEFVRFLIAMCQKYGFTIATGFSERENNNLYNSALLIAASGVIGKYRKLHLFMNEKQFFNSGDLGLPVFKIGNVTVGMLICFDWQFPEVWRKMALQGVDIILHPSNLVLPYAQSVIPSYALVNRIFITTANRIGTEGDLTFTGNSIIVNSKGECLAKATDKTEVIIADIDINLARNKMITPQNHAFTDRRTDVY